MPGVRYCEAWWFLPSSWWTPPASSPGGAARLVLLAPAHVFILGHLPTTTMAIKMQDGGCAGENQCYPPPGIMLATRIPRKRARFAGIQPEHCLVCCDTARTLSGILLYRQNIVWIAWIQPEYFLVCYYTARILSSMLLYSKNIVWYAAKSKKIVWYAGIQPKHCLVYLDTARALSGTLVYSQNIV